MYAHLATQIPNATISIISPPLVPTSPAPATLPHLAHLCKTLLQAASQADDGVMTFLGDSSGGNLVLSLMLSALQTDASLPPPFSIVLLCPSVDLRLTNPAIKQVEKHDPLLQYGQEIQTSKDWAGGWSLNDPRLSPLLADLAIIREKGVKVHGITAGYDILAPDALLFREKLRDASIGREWLQWDQ
ncbi:MAG: hypothetical protein Q9214_001307 [Letrouitia sp. 1 TL-2023]